MLIAQSYAKQDAFASRNVSTWLGYLNKYGLMAQGAVDQFKAAMRSSGMTKGLMLECLQAFAADAVSADEIEEYHNKILNTYQSMVGLPKASFRLTTLARIASTAVDPRIGLSEAVMAKTEGTTQPLLQFTHEIKVVINTEVSFERHLAKQLPARNYLPMALDLNGIEELGPQAVPLFFQLIDVLYAFQDKVQMAAKELLGLHLAGLDEHAPLLYSRVISSYLLSLREDELADPQAMSKSSNSPCPIIFFVQLANKLHKAFEN